MLTRLLARLLGLQVPAKPAPPAVDPLTLAGAHALGRDGGSGMTATPVDYTDAGGRVDMLGGFVVAPTAVPVADLTPASLYADRPLYGGVRSAPATREYVPDPGMTGGHEVITGRPLVQLDRQSAVPTGVPAVVRQVPRVESDSTLPGSCDERAFSAADAPADPTAMQRASVANALGWATR